LFLQLGAKGIKIFSSTQKKFTFSGRNIRTILRLITTFAPQNTQRENRNNY